MSGGTKKAEELSGREAVEQVCCSPTTHSRAPRPAGCALRSC